MLIKKHIDHGNAFDWGRTSVDYAAYRDIYPPAFYEKLLKNGLCTNGQAVLDLGTGTGVLPRNLYPFGAKFTGIDISRHQIRQAVSLAKKAGMNIDFQCVAAEEAPFPDGSFDVITACQCFTYFDHATLAPILSRLLVPGGIVAIMYMAWLPLEDKIAKSSEELILSYNPSWTGCGETRHPIEVPDCYLNFFVAERQEVFDLQVPFTRESWNGRIKTCRGVEASLTKKDVQRFHEEHMAMLARIAPQAFDILHYAAITLLKRL